MDAYVPAAIDVPLNKDAAEIAEAADELPDDASAPAEESVQSCAEADASEQPQQTLTKVCIGHPNLILQCTQHITII